MNNTKDVDICLLLEGTYPYIRGGVSSWVHQMIKGLPEYNFYLVFLGGEEGTYGEKVYELPENVVGIQLNYLLQKPNNKKPRPRSGNHYAFYLWQEILGYFQDTQSPLTNDLLQNMLDNLNVKKKLTVDDFLYSEASWKVITEIYEKLDGSHSFVDFFWTFRNIYAPLFELTKIARELPECKLYHSISTGYAGFLGALCHQKSKKPYILTEHGIYTKERKIDLSQASWIPNRHSAFDASIHKKMEMTRGIWIRFFEQLGITAYHHADKIIALYDGNRKRQIIDGAPAKKTNIIVNGINYDHFIEAYELRPLTPPKVVGLIGRVVPIKDIKTFIRSMRVAINRDHKLEGWIIGPADEDIEYYEECKTLVESLSLTGKIKFLGMQNVKEILPKIGVVILTSISEAQPLVLLESMAAGIPCIATEVGSCREIIYGMSDDDKALGSCGEIIQIASPNSTADAINFILSDTVNWKKMGDIGRKRVKKYYVENMMYESYKKIYSEGISWQG